MIKDAGMLAALAAGLAGLLYLARQARRLAAAVDKWAELPARHAELADATRVNTASIRSLTIVVDQLVRAEYARGGSW